MGGGIKIELLRNNVEEKYAQLYALMGEKVSELVDSFDNYLFTTEVLIA